MRKEIVEAIARSLFVQAYADFIEDQKQAKRSLSGLPYPGPGQDWMDHSPETSAGAREVAEKAAESIEKLNNKGLEEIFRIAIARCDAVCKAPVRKHTTRSFGHDLGMMLTGSGVSWFDDHPKFHLKVPTALVYILCRADITDTLGEVSEIFVSTEEE